MCGLGGGGLRTAIRTRLVELATRRFVNQLASDVLTLAKLQRPRPDTSKVGSRIRV